jgi:hypothetical protein
MRCQRPLSLARRRASALADSLPATALRKLVTALRLVVRASNAASSPCMAALVSTRAACVTAMSSPRPPSLTVVVPLPLHHTDPAAASKATARAMPNGGNILGQGLGFVMASCPYRFARREKQRVFE